MSTAYAGGVAAARTPQAAGKVVLYNYADYVDPKTYAAFATQYPTTEVVKAYYASEEEVSAKLRAGGVSQYDNVVVAGTTAAQLNAEGLLRPIDHSLLPNLAGVDPALIGQVYDRGAVFSVPHQALTEEQRRILRGMPHPPPHPPWSPLIPRDHARRHVVPATRGWRRA